MFSKYTISKINYLCDDETIANRMTSYIHKQLFTRPFVWLKRFRHRCGYGVHSPFAFGFITDVIYEKLAYYCYMPLREEVKLTKHTHPKSWDITPERVNRLLFRIANYRQPDTIVISGETSSATLYMQEARHAAKIYSSDNAPSDLRQIDMLYINSSPAELAEAAFDKAAPLLTERSICIVMNIYSSAEMRQCWQHMKEMEQSGITFDLYDLGIIFFDRKKIKQHYIVNF